MRYALIFFTTLLLVSISLFSTEDKKYVLVTGGAGYIGSHTCKELFKAGYIPVVYDSLSTGNAKAVKWGPLIQGDLSDASLLEKTFSSYKFLAVLHFAALTSVEESVASPLKYYQNNIAFTLTLLEAMVKAGVDKIIFSSSASVYGCYEKMPLIESSPLSPISPYGKTKSMMEEVLADCFKAYGMRSVALRYFNVAGADMDGEIGCNKKGQTNLIPLVLQVAAKKKNALTIFGTDYPTKDGTAVRDYIHVADIAKAHVLALEYLLNDKSSAVINLGTGRGYSVKEIADTVEKITKQPIHRIYSPRRHGDPAVSIASYAKAKELLGWSPRFSDLENIISTDWKWEQSPSIEQKP